MVTVAVVLVVIVVFFLFASSLDFGTATIAVLTAVFDAVLWVVKVIVVVMVLVGFAWLMLETSPCDDLLPSGVNVVGKCLKGEL